MQWQDNLLPQLFELLNTKYCYAVLRNYESLPESLDGRDIDILLAPEQFPDFQRDCAELAVVYSYKILYTHRDEQFWSVVFGCVEAGIPRLIQLDIMLNLNVMGVIFLDERRVLAERTFNGKVYHLPLKYVFLSKYIYSRVLNAPYPEKYSHILKDTRQTCASEVDSILCSLLNSPSANLDYWESNGGRNLILKGLVASFRRHPLRQLERITLFVFYNVLHRFNRRGLFITFSGPDGSGKTTVIEKVIDVLGMVNLPILFHFRPTLFPNLGEVGVKLKVKEDVDRRYEIPHRGERKGVVTSIVRLMYYMSDYIMGYWLKVMPLLYRKHIVIFDRYFTDIIVDGERSSIFLNFKCLSPLRKILPRSRYNFLIRVEPEKIITRKQELTLDAIERIYTRLDYLAKYDKSYYWIDNNGIPEQAVVQIISTLLDQQHRIWYPKLTGSKYVD